MKKARKPKTHPARRDAEALLTKSWKTVTRIMKSELGSENRGGGILNFHMRSS